MYRVLTVLILIFTLTGLIVAQDNDAVDLFGSGADISQVFNQDATSGTIIPLDGGLDEPGKRYQLVLEGVDAETDIFYVAPTGIVKYETEVIAKHWAALSAADGFDRAAAELMIDNAIVVFILDNANYDATTGTMIYEGELFTAASLEGELVLGEGVGKFDVPESFSNATLTISWTGSFWSSFRTSEKNQPEFTRDPMPEECAEAEFVIDNPNDYSLEEFYAARAYYNINCR